ncbi:MAG: hypothetical protein P8183_13670 [Anaerolineae bacterium]|jgi:hypothetical protein
MSKKDSSLHSQTDWKRLDAMEDKDIDLSDIPELTEEDFKHMRPTAEVFKERGLPYPIEGPVQVKVLKEDGSTEIYELDSGPKQRIIMLDPDVGRYFPDSESVNRTLRSLIALIPQPSD